MNNEPQDNIKLDIFKYETTYQNDYQKFGNAKDIKLSACQKRLYEEPKIKRKEPVYQDNETFITWRKDAHVPFDLLVKPNDITRSDPYKPFEVPVIPEDPEKSKVMKTRPRIYMSPAVSIDDVSDPDTRHLLCSHMYTTDWKKATEESIVKRKKRNIPNTTVEQNVDAIQLKVDLLPSLPQSFQNRGKQYEEAQSRTGVDPTRMYWQHKDPPVKCGACINPVEGLVPEETKNEIKELISKDKLRLAHDNPIPGYTGYRPRLSYGVPLSKVDLPVTHPFLSVTQAITKRYADDETN